MNVQQKPGDRLHTCENSVEFTKSLRQLPVARRLAVAQQDDVIGADPFQDAPRRLFDGFIPPVSAGTAECDGNQI